MLPWLFYDITVSALRLVIPENVPITERLSLNLCFFICRLVFVCKDHSGTRLLVLDSSYRDNVWLAEPHIHGWGLDKEQAIDRFNIIKKSLVSLGYAQPIIDLRGTLTLYWNNAINAATHNGYKLAQFILDYKIACENADIRIIGRSLGARVVLNILFSLYNNEMWNERGYKIASAHLIGAAVNPIEVSEDYYGSSTQNVNRWVSQ